MNSLKVAEKPLIELRIQDKSLEGKISSEIILILQSRKVKVRDLIEQRVRQEVVKTEEDLIRDIKNTHYSLVNLPIIRAKQKKLDKIDVEEQVKVALTGFENNAFFILIDDKQVETLEEEVTITPKTSMQFIKLIPLVGG
jgi:hypothetical protein